ncbi:MAG: MBL fold metallo-hydrolase [Lentisphaeria bacterium]|nr:MBL fold metallo-hydrolase [Lentisphaeria bacterium]
MKNKNLLNSMLACISLSCRAVEIYNFKDMQFETDIAKREKMQDAMQNVIDKTTQKEFDQFDNNPNSKTANPVLKYYDQSLERLVKDIPATQVKPGTAAIWYLYNMGFVIKTPEVCFGIDIHHRHADKLASFLDFIAVTHNHNDHYSMPLLGKISAAQKTVISNFFPNPGYTKAAEFTHNIKGVTIYCGEADHNDRLKKFTVPMEFVCPTGDKKFVFFTSGDCFSHEFLNRKSEKIDLYVLHPRCGMTPVNAVQKLNPELTFIGHLQELGHDINVWRWQFAVGRHEVAELKKINHKAYVPVWGEKFIWDGEKIIGCQK